MEKPCKSDTRIHAYGFCHNFTSYWMICIKIGVLANGGIMTHQAALWATVDYIAKVNNISCSHLARICNLDATTFNRSKRSSRYGQPRWISTETLDKILTNTKTTPVEFAQIFESYLGEK